MRGYWEEIRIKAGLPKFTFHNLRNMSVSLLADMGESSATLMKHLNHKDIKTTEGYIGVSNESLERAADKLNTVISDLLQS